MSDSPKHEKTGKPLTARQQLRNLFEGMLDEEGGKVSRKDRTWAEGMIRELDSARIGEAEAANFIEGVRGGLAEPNWAKKITGKRPVPARQELRSFLNWVLDREEAPPDLRATAERMLKDLNRSKIGEAEATKFMAHVRGEHSEPEWAGKVTKKTRGPYRIK